MNQLTGFVVTAVLAGTTCFVLELVRCLESGSVKTALNPGSDHCLQLNLMFSWMLFAILLRNIVIVIVNLA